MSTPLNHNRHSVSFVRTHDIKVSTKAEGGLSSEADGIKEQAREGQRLKEGENRLQSAAAYPAWYATDGEARK